MFVCVRVCVCVCVCMCCVYGLCVCAAVHVRSSAVERGGRGVSWPGPRGKRGAPRSLRKNLFDNFSILTANVNPFHVSYVDALFTHNCEKKNSNENIILLNGFWR